MRTGSFRDGVTRVSWVFVMIVTKITVLVCDNVTKKRLHSLLKAVCASGGVGKP